MLLLNFYKMLSLLQTCVPKAREIIINYECLKFIMLGIQFRCEMYVINSLLIVINFSLDFHKNRILVIWWEIQLIKTYHFSLCDLLKCVLSSFRCP